ncbi:MAG TPA: hypothetical protein VF324_07460 [Methanobacterium sp.]
MSSVKVVEKFLRPIGMSNIVSIARKRDDEFNGQGIKFVYQIDGI